MTRSGSGRPPPSSSQHRDRTRTLVSWSETYLETYGDTTPLRTPNLQHRCDTSTRGVWINSYITCTSSPRGTELVKSYQVHRYWYSSPWNPGHITWVWGGSREGSPDHISALGWGKSSACWWKLHLRNSTVCPKGTSSLGEGWRDVNTQAQVFFFAFF